MTTAANTPKLELEVHPCQLLDEHGAVLSQPRHTKHTSYSQCDSKDHNIAIWGVYRHLPEGGVESIVDCASEEGAEFVAELIEKLYKLDGGKIPIGPQC